MYEVWLQKSSWSFSTSVKYILYSLVFCFMQVCIRFSRIVHCSTHSHMIFFQKHQQRQPELTAMAKHDDHGMTWYDHDDSYSPRYDHSKIMAWSSWDVAWSWHGRHGMMKNSKTMVRKVFWPALTYSFFFFFFSKEWVALMIRVALRMLFGTTFPEAVC